MYYSTTDIKVSTASKLISLSLFISSIGKNLENSISSHFCLKSPTVCKVVFAHRNIQVLGKILNEP